MIVGVDNKEGLCERCMWWYEMAEYGDKARMQYVVGVHVCV